MTRPIFLTRKFWGNLARYALYFLCVIVTPYLAKPVAELFDWVGYGQVYGFFVELFTAIFWLLEFTAIIIVENIIRKKLTVRAAENEADKEDPEETSKETEEKGKKEKKANNPPLPIKNVAILTAITVLCILIISIQTGFVVKPIYDIGEKVTGHQLLNKVGIIVKNIVKCVWVMLFLKAGLAMAEELVNGFKTPKKWAVWLIGGVMLLLFGIYDVIASANPFWFTYLLFYVVFTAIYYFTERSNAKSYLLTVFIYIF